MWNTYSVVKIQIKIGKHAVKSKFQLTIFDLRMDCK